jgi:hypothetical protein
MSLSPFGMLMYLLMLGCLYFTVRPELVEGLTKLPNLKTVIPAGTTAKDSDLNMVSLPRRLF